LERHFDEDEDESETNPPETVQLTHFMREKVEPENSTVTSLRQSRASGHPNDE
ncbi:hypothetical protein FRB91_010702, partial [Serendipita sp. 411]